MQQRPRVGRPPLEPEIVEDSEPERERERQARKLERKRRKLAATQVHSGPVVVISDSMAPRSPSPLINAVIEISDTSSEPREVISLHTSVASAEPPQLSSDDEEIAPTLNIARFAFPSRPLQRRDSSLTAASSNSDNQPKAPPKKAATRKLANGNLASDAQLKKLTKCVSCDAAWTVRKTGEQKLVHIRKCAKKSGFTDETVRLLITKAVENLPGDSKGKGKAPPEPATLLEELVDGPPKRRGRRKQVSDTLKDVSETRKNIADHARVAWGSGDDSIVQTQALRAETREPAATQAFGPSRLAQRHKPSLDSDDEPPSTQAFAPSKLGQFAQRQKTLLGYDEEPPPPTQAFAPSKLGGRSTATGGPSWGYESASEDAASGSETSLKKGNLSRKEAFPRFATTSIENELAPTNDWDDGAYVHYDPDHDERNIVQPTAKPKTKRTTAAASPTKTKRSRKKAGAEDEFDETWQVNLRDKIMQDQDLYFRILRYEPIDFNIFLKLVNTDEEPAGGKLRFALRSFLDKQAINFYGGEAGPGRNRTKKR
ncbi:hypothetical protein FB45DRAFT_1023726 [Roridomyces roridus]|uniref:Uncharacterized protein n=1 Tax=Roridomyces roridus TaxID=1738132 RepID=A0AAD7C4P4_9AGAR|nr:hypothetical protein FB45DRAFT_1023726 [Roridomyces roridus]